MEERRSKIFWKSKFTFPFFIISIAWVLIFALLGFSLLINYVLAVQHALQYPFAWGISFVIFVLTLIVAIVFLFITMFILLHRSVGAISRIEAILDKIINGNYSLRITVRKKDIIHSFVDKLNKILDLLEKKTKSTT